MPADFWTDARVTLLKELRPLGLSAGQIAKEIGDGCTRCSVIGKLRRLDLPLMGKAVNGRGWQEHTPRRARMPKPEVVDDDAPPESLRISLQDIRDGQCKFISADPLTDSSMCGWPTEFGRSYCPRHDKICWDKVATARYT